MTIKSSYAKLLWLFNTVITEHETNAPEMKQSCDTKQPELEALGGERERYYKRTAEEFYKTD